jgi:hypothetical protein
MIGRTWRRLKYFLFRERATRELEDEMRLHRELRAEALMSEGADEPTARAEASRSRDGTAGDGSASMPSGRT